MLLSRRCEYGLRAVLYLASQASAAPVPVRAVSRVLRIPHAFLAQTVQALVSAGIVHARPGTGGGLTLARSAGEVSLKDVVLALDGPQLFEACVLRMPGCGDLQPCPLHEAWVAARERIERLLHTTTLAALGEALRTHDYRLSGPAGPGP